VIDGPDKELTPVPVWASMKLRAIQEGYVNGGEFVPESARSARIQCLGAEQPGQGGHVTDDLGIGKKRVWTPSRVR
jgi:hypothetical protein